LVEDLHRLKSGGTVRGDKTAQVGKRMDRVLDAAARFEDTENLNIYKKAKLLALVREGLNAKGWDAADIDAINNQLLTSRLRKRTS
jgi:hypothetical protein